MKTKRPRGHWEWKPASGILGTVTYGKADAPIATTLLSITRVWVTEPRPSLGQRARAAWRGWRTGR